MVATDLVDAHLAEVVDQVLLEGVPDGSLGVGAAHVHRHLVQLVARQLGAAHDEAHLGAVAVRDRHIPAGFDELGDVVIGRRRQPRTGPRPTGGPCR